MGAGTAGVAEVRFHTGGEVKWMAAVLICLWRVLSSFRYVIISTLCLKVEFSNITICIPSIFKQRQEAK
jgi:hypothetical protein